MSMLRFAVLCGPLVLISALASAEDLAPMALNGLSQTPKLESMSVSDQQGHAVGTVERIQADQYGKPSALAIRTAAGNTVVVSAAAVSYDGRTLVTSSDQPQIAALTQPQRTASTN